VELLELGSSSATAVENKKGGLMSINSRLRTFRSYRGRM